MVGENEMPSPAEHQQTFMAYQSISLALVRALVQTKNTDLVRGGAGDGLVRQRRRVVRRGVLELLVGLSLVGVITEPSMGLCERGPFCVGDRCAPHDE
jgi:hypothetical protein